MKYIKQLVCKIFGHKINHEEPGRYYVKCQRCGEDTFELAFERGRESYRKKDALKSNSTNPKEIKDYGNT